MSKTPENTEPAAVDETAVSDDELDLGARPMPPFVRRGLIRVQGGMVYLKAAHRVLWMRDEHADWSITTEIVHADWTSQFVVMKATVYDGEGKTVATAHYEKKGGNTPFLRTAETGAISRALGLCGYGTQFGDFDEDASDIADSPQGRETARPQQQSNRPQQAQGAPPKQQALKPQQAEERDPNAIATAEQVKAIQNICKGQGWDANQTAIDWYKTPLTELNTGQASKMIKDLNASIKAAA
jgi:hypothetical protein